MNNKFLLISILAIYIIAAFFACEKVPETTYQDVKLIISTSCAVTDCHNATTAESNVDCTSFATMSGNGGRKNILNKDSRGFHDRVLVQKDMPPLGTLTQSDLDLLQAWVDEGFPENK